MATFEQRGKLDVTEQTHTDMPSASGECLSAGSPHANLPTMRVNETNRSILPAATDRPRTEGAMSIETRPKHSKKRKGMMSDRSWLQTIDVPVLSGVHGCADAIRGISKHVLRSDATRRSEIRRKTKSGASRRGKVRGETSSDATGRSEVEEKIDIVRRPLNKFMLYRRAYSDAAEGILGYRDHQRISVIVGISWKKEDEAIKEQFKRFAEIEEQAHRRAFPNYHFRPNKDRRARQEERKTHNEETMTDPMRNVPAELTSLTSLTPEFRFALPQAFDGFGSMDMYLADPEPLPQQAWIGPAYGRYGTQPLYDGVTMEGEAFPQPTETSQLAWLGGDVDSDVAAHGLAADAAALTDGRLLESFQPGRFVPFFPLV